jgi:glycosyltransferase involved in cell wall biosynthesis
LTREANALTLSRNASVIAVSKAVAESMARPVFLPWVEWPSIQVIYHGIDADHVCRGGESHQTAREALGLERSDFAIGTVGNLTAKKDHRTMLEAVALLAPNHEHLRVVIVGDGPLRSELQSLAGSLGISGRVIFTGSRSDVAMLLPGLDVFALSSLYEGFPIALVEAMASGLACVATRVGGTPELIRHRQNGFLIPPRDPVLLAAAISELISEPELRQSLGRQAAEDSLRYSLPQAVEALQRIYSEVSATR